MDSPTGRGYRNTLTPAAFGPVLRQLRRKVGSQATFAQRARIDRTFLSQMERSIRQPSLAVFIDIASALGVDPTKLLTLTLVEMKRARRTPSGQKQRAETE
jgi:transcriptional regulator with XRE-family HTH domain